MSDACVIDDTSRQALELGVTKKRPPLGAEEQFYKEHINKLLLDEMARLSPKKLSTILIEAGLPEIAPQSLTNKLHRGTYPCFYALHVLAALGFDEIKIPKLPDVFTLRVSLDTKRFGTYTVPSRVRARLQGVFTAENAAGVKGQLRFAGEIVTGLNEAFGPVQNGGAFTVDPNATPMRVEYLPP